MKKKRVLIIAGCSLEFTPVVRGYLAYLGEAGVDFDVVEYSGFERFSFLKRSFRKLKQYGASEKIVCVNFQSLPVLLIAAFIRRQDLVYWKLESRSPFENVSLALKLQLLEWLLPRHLVSLVLPIAHRALFQRPKFEKVSILPNAPLHPYVADSFTNVEPQSHKFVIYGSIASSDKIYVREWAEYFAASNLGHLSVYGGQGPSTEAVSFHGKIGHDALIEVLMSGSFDYSFVGYRDLDMNTRFAAPNKLIESLSCGVPVIGHVGNPAVVELIEQYGCGFCVDFENLKSVEMPITPEQFLRHKKNAIRAAKILCLSAQIRATPLNISL